MLKLLLIGCVVTAGMLFQAQQPPAPATQARIDAAIDNGAKFLLGAYAGRVDGKLVALERVGQSALSLYTLLKAGVSRDDPTVQRLVAHVLSQPIDQTYDATCAILALCAHDGIENRRWVEELARKLVGWQLEGGDWGYPAGFNDLSNTQYAALGLWVAANDGVPIDASVWKKLAGATLGYQSTDGSFGYGPAGSQRTGGTGSMTAAGVGTLAMCELRLRTSGDFPESLATKLASARARGLDWLAHNFSVTTNPKSGAWLFYYLYGLERLGAVTGVARLGEHDWYAEGAAYLTAQQAASGAWLQGTDVADTCFAVLFLKRATSARRAPVTGEQPVAEADAPLRIACTGAGVVRVFVARWNPKLARELEWPGERGRGPRVARVEYLADGKLCAVVLGDLERADSSETWSATHVFDSLGKHRLAARVFVLAPGAKPEERVLDSQELELDVTRAMPRWTAELFPELGVNLAQGAKAKVKASSRVKLKDAPLGLDCSADAIIDGHGATPWLADAKDEQRSLSLTFTDPPTCNVIRISPAVLPALGATFLARPIELELAINGKDKRRVAFDPDPLHPARIELDHPTLVRRLDLEILSVAASESSPLVGIGEVELFLRK
ncbi:MAG TPA: hypothetical protein VM509_06150 [Planctomycetota bacterium]|nr:hypothetical protein [Planctomycetota bacterium]